MKGISVSSKGRLRTTMPKEKCLNSPFPRTDPAGLEIDMNTLTLTWPRVLRRGTWKSPCTNGRLTSSFSRVAQEMTSGEKLIPFQCGFRNERSTQSAFEISQTAIPNHFAEQKHIITVFSDREKAHKSTFKYGATWRYVAFLLSH